MSPINWFYYIYNDEWNMQVEENILSVIVLLA